MNKVDMYKTAFELTQDGNSVLLFAFESTKPVVYELLISEYTNTPLEVLRADRELAKIKQEEFINEVIQEREMFVVSEVILTNAEIEDKIKYFKENQSLTHVVFDKVIEIDFTHNLQRKYSIDVVSCNYRTN